MPLRKHDFQLFISVRTSTEASELYRCYQCGCHKDVENGVVSYVTALSEDQLTEAPCCVPPFDPDISDEDLAKAGYVRKAQCPPV